MLPTARVATMNFVETKRCCLLKPLCARWLRPNIVSLDRQRGWRGRVAACFFPFLALNFVKCIFACLVCLMKLAGSCMLHRFKMVSSVHVIFSITVREHIQLNNKFTTTTTTTTTNCGGICGPMQSLQLLGIQTWVFGLKIGKADCMRIVCNASGEGWCAYILVCSIIQECFQGHSQATCRSRWKSLLMESCDAKGRRVPSIRCDRAWGSNQAVQTKDICNQHYNNSSKALACLGNSNPKKRLVINQLFWTLSSHGCGRI